MNPPSNRRGSNEEIVDHRDRPGRHAVRRLRAPDPSRQPYNCFKVDEIATRTGFTKLGIDNVGTLITRGVLIDVAGFKGVEMLPRHLRDHGRGPRRRAARSRTSRCSPATPCIIHTGWGKLWGKDNARYVKSCPGIGVAAAEWLVAKDPMLLGADNWPVEVAPNPDPQLSLPVHQIALVVNGMHLLENLKLDELAAKRVYEFAFVMQPLKIQGGTGLDGGAGRGAVARGAQHASRTRGPLATLSFPSPACGRGVFLATLNSIVAWRFCECG